MTAQPRHLLFRAGDIDVDVEIQSNGNEGITLSGQVLSGEANFFDNTPVTLESGGLVRYRTYTNEMGEFSFEVPKDTYHIYVDLPEAQIVILEVPRRHPAKA
jgi:hypothetical protein